MPISKQLYSNNAKTTLTSPISNSDTTITVADGSLFPSPGVGEYFLATIEYGGVIEIIKVQGKVSNTFTSIVRAQEGTVANGFPSGGRIECRVTKGTLESFARKIDRVDELESLDLMTPTDQSNSNSYICNSLDDSGNPIFAFKNPASTTNWKFLNYTLAHVIGSASSGTNTTLQSTAIATNVANVQSGKYLIQFLTGSNAGRCRLINASTSNLVSWTTALPNPIVAGDQFEIYKSDSSNLKELIAASGVVVSDPAKANVNNATLTGTTTIARALITNQLDVRSVITANTATTSLDLSTAAVFRVTIAATTQFDFTNTPAGANVFSFTLITVNDATANRGVAFPAGKMQWAGGITPPRTTSANAVDVWTFFTEDAGVTWKGSLAIANVK